MHLEWLERSLQSGQIVESAGSMTAYRAEHLGSEMIHAGLLDASRLPPGTVAVLPLGSLLLALLYYAVSKDISGSSVIAVATTVFASWYYPRLVTQSATSTYVWSNALFLTFLLLLRHWLLRRTFFASILLALVFVATFLHYHTTSLWIIAALIAAVAAMKLRAKRRPDLFSAPSWALPLFCF
jgi:hypothetical protein